ncbi:Interferon-induced very large GTPase 1, partial [Egretta garzetta]
CFQISCQGSTSITTFAVFLCDKIAPALHQAVYKKTALAIAQDVRDKIPDFSGNRHTLEICILRQLAQEENFDNFKEYLYFPEEFFQSYIERRVVEYCLDKNRRLEKFLNDSLTHYYGRIQSAVFESTNIVKHRKDRNDKISLWLDEFCSALGEVLSLPRKDLKGIEHQEVTDIEFLSNAMAEVLAPLRDSLREGFASADMSSFERQPHTILAEQFAGCWEQCPFCGAVCTNTMKNHDGDHYLVFHRPQVL